MALNYRGDWALSTAYAVDDYVTDVNNDSGQGAGTLIYCRQGHTSSSSDLSNDWNAGYWEINTGSNAFYNNSETDGGPRLVNGTLATATEVEDKFNAVAAGFDKVEVTTNNPVTLSSADNTIRDIPEGAQDRANKFVGFDANGDLYIDDTMIAPIGDFVKRDGSTSFTGNQQMEATPPTDDSHLTRKDYVDTADALKADKIGALYEGTVAEYDAEGNLRVPTQPTDGGVYGRQDLTWKKLFTQDSDGNYYFQGNLIAPGMFLEELNLALTTDGAVVDVFIYDTATDDDGGAWVDQASSQSWYHETLNTEVRGNKASFPKVAVIVAEAAKVTIYDGTQADLPMWMVFNISSANIIRGAGINVTNVVAKNGIMYAGGGDVYTYQHIYFINDSGLNHRANGYADYYGNVSERNAGKNFGAPYGTGIVNSTVNDIAVTSDGQMNNTVAVATDGGVSVIHPDGSVADITRGVGIEITRGVDIVDGRLWILFDTANVPWVTSMDIPLSDIVGNPPAGANLYTPTSIPALGDTSVQKLSNTTIGLTTNICRIQEDETAQEKGMVAYITNDYNSGWMQGDIRACYLANDAITDRSVKATNAVANGTISSSTIGELDIYWRSAGSGYIVANGQFAFGTGDFSISVWMSPLSSSFVFDMEAAPGAGSVIAMRMSALTAQLLVSSNPTDLRDIALGEWVLVTVIRESGVVRAYIDGVLLASGISSVTNITDGNIIILSNRAITWNGSYQALFRVSASVPSVEQIQHMYQTEKPLFQDNAKCLLQGSSSSVTTLAHSEKDDILSVAAGDHITRFSGLKVVSDDAASPTPTSISRSCTGAEVTGV